MFHKFADKSKRPYRQSAGRLGWARSSSIFALEIKESRLLEIHPTALVHLNTSFNAQLLVSHSSPNYGQISASYRLPLKPLAALGAALDVGTALAGKEAKTFSSTLRRTLRSGASGFSLAAAASIQQKPVQQTSGTSLLVRSAERKMHSKVVSEYPSQMCLGLL
jgi:hypothetical protein